MKHAEIQQISPLVDVKEEYITPDMAQEYLKRNYAGNRNIRRIKVLQYAKTMADGNWAMTGEAIKFSIDGNLIDGQHRLMAVVESNSVCRFLVVRGLPQNSYYAIDQGMKRGKADALGIDKPVIECLAAMLSFIHVRHDDPMVLKKAYDNIPQCQEFHENITGTSKKGITSAAIRTGCVAAILGGGDLFVVAQQYNDLVHGNFDKVPKIQGRLAIKVAGGALRKGQYRDKVIAQSYVAFSPQFENRQQLQVGKEVMEYIHNLFLKATQ